MGGFFIREEGIRLLIFFRIEPLRVSLCVPYISDVRASAKHYEATLMGGFFIREEGIRLFDLLSHRTASGFIMRSLHLRCQGIRQM